MTACRMPPRPSSRARRPCVRADPCAGGGAPGSALHRADPRGGAQLRSAGGSADGGGVDRDRPAHRRRAGALAVVDQRGRRRSMARSSPRRDRAHPRFAGERRREHRRRLHAGEPEMARGRLRQPARPRSIPGPTSPTLRATCRSCAPARATGSKPPATTIPPIRPRRAPLSGAPEPQLAARCSTALRAAACCCRRRRARSRWTSSGRRPAARAARRPRRGPAPGAALRHLPPPGSGPGAGASCGSRRP